MKKLPLILFITALIFFSFLKLSSISIWAREENIEDAEIIKPVQSIICTDFNIDLYKKTEEPTNTTTATTSQVQGAEIKSQTVTGDIKLENIKQPDFSQIDNYLNLTMPKLLPISLVEKVNIKTEDSNNLESRELHIIYSDTDEDKSSPETKIKNPDWWTNLLGQSKIFCGLLNKNSKICEAPKKLNLVIEQPNFESNDSNNQLTKMKGSICKKAETIIGQEAKLENIETKFQTKSLFEIIKDQIEKFINGIKKLFIKTEEKSQLKEESWGYLTGGANLTAESAFFSSFIPYGIDSKITDSPLAGDSSYVVDIPAYSDVSLSGDNTKNNFQGQNLARARYCLQLCSLYPSDAKFNVNGIDPICISCNPKDYQN